MTGNKNIMFNEIVYKTVGRRDLKLDMYGLNKASSSRQPVSVFIHGGGWRIGTREALRADTVWSGILNMLLERDYIVIGLEYRFTNDTIKFPVHLEDCKDSIRWLRKNAAVYNIDSENISVWGASAGGHLALMTGLTPDGTFQGDSSLSAFSSNVSSIVSWFGPTDFISWVNYKEIPKWIVDEVIYLFDGTPTDRMDAYKKASPINYIKGSSPPILLIHGENDDAVPLLQSEELYHKGKLLGAEISLVPIREAGHGPQEFNKENNIPLLDEVTGKMIDFITSHMK